MSYVSQRDPDIDDEDDELMLELVLEELEDEPTWPRLREQSGKRGVLRGR
jgi:hypothetical protein